MKVLIVTMYVVATAGAGIASFDHIAGLGLSGALWGLIGLVVGLGTGAAVLSTRKPEPQEEVEPTPKELPRILPSSLAACSTSSSISSVVRMGKMIAHHASDVKTSQLTFAVR